MNFGGGQGDLSVGPGLGGAPMLVDTSAHMSSVYGNFGTSMSH